MENKFNFTSQPLKRTYWLHRQLAIGKPALESWQGAANDEGIPPTAERRRRYLLPNRGRSSCDLPSKPPPSTIESVAQAAV